ncbi:MAG TPA: hypothetical protein VN685_08060 [Rhizomicrobium sp.]|nr:hypothetical protein [Rhizomicrobium sp.]
MRRASAMRYFFHIRDEGGLIMDREGTELPDIDAARKEARLSARDFAMDDLRGGRRVAERRIEITDGEGLMLEALQARDIVN